MESVPLNAEAIAFTEKKMDMTLEDIIKMSKKKNPAGKKAPRQPIKKRPFQNGNGNQGNAKVQRFIESRSSIRQGVLAQRRSNLDGNQFQITKQAAKKAAAMPVRGRADRWSKQSAPSTSIQRRPVSDQNSKGKEMQNEQPRTMDALFAQMKQQRMRIMPPQQSSATHGHQFQQQRRVQQQRRGRGGYGARNGGGNR
ncbi:uncharacterized protein LOC124684368 [Lolium rigidum]|uniref:uncharacterized protein LOC124684368 n=1 Tax=Lolium rigidum TaxID=89674 RepID=UPI001F5E2EA0|nr:uncharacterized protein LOC124684368 [Lolium rigidum]